MRPLDRPLYGSFAWAYDLLVPGSAGLSPELVARLLEERGAGPPGSLLDAGCGTGRHAVELARRGYEVSAVDRSGELVAVAAERSRVAATRVRFVVADLTGWLGATPFDAALCRGVLNDLVRDLERGRALAALAGALRRGAPLVLDVRDWEASAARYGADPVYQRSADSPRGRVAFRSETRVWEPQHALVVRERYQVEGPRGRMREECTFMMRCWTRPELLAAARDAGFADVELLDEPEVREDRIVAVAVR